MSQLMRNIYFYFALAIISLITFFIYFILNTTAGLILLGHLTAHFLPGQFQFGTVQGTILKTFSINNIIYENNQFTFKLNHLQLTWQPKQLRHGKLYIDDVMLDQLTYQEKKADITSSFSFPSWLQHLQIQKIEAKSILINTQYEQYDIPEIAIHKIAHSANDEINIKLKDGEIHGKYQLITHPSLFWQGEIHLSQPNTKASFSGKVDKQWELQFKFQTPQIERWISSIKGQIDVAGSIKGDFNTPIINALANSRQIKIQKYFINNAHAQVQAYLSIKNNFSHVNYHSRIHLQAEQLALPEIGIQLKKMAILGNQSDHLIDFSGQFQSGIHWGKLSGQLDTKKFTLQALLTGKNLQGINLPEYKINISPHVNILMDAEKIKLTGNILIPSASITPAQIDDAVTLPSEAIIQSNRPNIAMPTSLPLDVNLTFRLEKEAYLNYKNFKGNLLGDLTILMQKDEFPIANGEFYTTKGTYKAYGQALTIQTGRITYAGNSLSNPGLLVRAVKKIKTPGINQTESFFSKGTTLGSSYEGMQTITAGIEVNGTFDKPLISLFSIPAGLKQNDILSYLLFGFPQNKISGNRLGILMQAAASLNSKQLGLENVTHKMQKIFGLSELNIQSTNYFDPTTQSISSTPMVGIGKKIGPNLSVNYQIGVLNPISILSLRYQLTKRLYLQSEKSPFENGIDLFYGFETD